MEVYACVSGCTCQCWETTSKPWLGVKIAKHSHGKIIQLTDTQWSETEKHPMWYRNESSYAKNTGEILTMRNHVGREAIFTVMRTSHPDGPPPAPQPQWLILCHVVLYTFFKAHMWDRRRAGRSNMFNTIFKRRDDKDFMNLCTFFASFKTVTHTSYSLAPTLQTLLSMIHYKLHVHFLHYICFPHPYTPMNNCKNLSHALMIASSNLTSFSIHHTAEFMPSLHNYLQ